MQLLKPTSFSPILALVGIVLIMFCKKDKQHNIGAIFIGFAILMFGMDTMSGAVKPLKDVPEFTNILTMFSNPILGMIAGAVLTAVIQSSSASVGILQSLCVTGSVNYSTVIPIIMGQNIGTCVTALISSIGASKNAKRTAFVHLYFNVIGTILFMVVFYAINAFVPFAFLNEPAGMSGIAIVHSVFNVCATLVLLPFSRVLEKLAYFSIPDKKEDIVLEAEPHKDEAELLILDERFLDKPAFAIMQSQEASGHMAELSKEALDKAVSLFWNYDDAAFADVENLENRVDRYDDTLGNYLLKLSSRDLSKKDSQTLSELLHCIGDFERIADHAINIAEVAKKMNNKSLAFSEKASKEIKVFSDAVKDIMALTTNVFVAGNIDLAKKVEPLEEVIDKLNKEVKKRHMKRLRKGKCSVELGFMLTDLSTDLERVADHCSNVAICIMHTQDEELEAHEYLETLDKGEDSEFRETYLAYKERYMLP